MNSQTVNVSTGPVQISKQVQKAFAASPISHRSKEFRHLYNDSTEFLCERFNAQKTYLLSGSGTVANEAMIWQIKLLGGKGLILSNGEFGERLIRQASRASLQFIEYALAWGEVFELQTLENEIEKNKIEWILFCHCETSTGVLNDFDSITEICVRNNCRCFVDCMSTIGTVPLDLSRVAMATASSGKGLASIPGLAIIFCNNTVVSSEQIPVYFDLGMYDKKDGIPFTLSSNLLKALQISARQKLQSNQFELIDEYAGSCFDLLKEKCLLSFNESRSKVFTVVQPGNTSTDLVVGLRQKNIIVSHESEYLKLRKWFQLAFFGYYKEVQLDRVFKTLQKVLNCPI
ncbi:aminotransferase class V-fold PLP-dependent enzyme [Segetibacter aerophilus]|uniref:Aminotransferase class V domain-containing protein n=1 Tax=Segetibacter aerophilus TaxID=670293 RepID=A0A512B7E8_9BACT|nr:aminotransferase class V-fold PLP-dependent enzyme [Segetibacter aerophilus]GEO07885.1 hypothetical protein SAE01_03810 [Segetibacter aerophilus]